MLGASMTVMRVWPFTKLRVMNLWIVMSDRPLPERLSDGTR
jgi:hypothetical protein